MRPTRLCLLLFLFHAVAGAAELPEPSVLVEDDANGTRMPLGRLAAQTDWATRGFLPLRTTARLLPHREDARSWSALRDHALALAESDPGFRDIRIKIHNRPDPGDVARVRDYAAGATGSDNPTVYSRKV